MYVKEFGQADVDKDGVVSPAEALAYFSKSKLPRPVLSQIWKTTQHGNAHRPPQFAAAMDIIHATLKANRAGVKNSTVAAAPAPPSHSAPTPASPSTPAPAPAPAPAPPPPVVDPPAAAVAAAPEWDVAAAFGAPSPAPAPPPAMTQQQQPAYLSTVSVPAAQASASASGAQLDTSSSSSAPDEIIPRPGGSLSEAPQASLAGALAPAAGASEAAEFDSFFGGGGGGGGGGGSAFDGRDAFEASVGAFEPSPHSASAQQLGGQQEVSGGGTPAIVDARFH
eukprot:COSAG01_NODE_2066_length_8507_cov_3.752141_7_plen_280_part_00